MIRLMGALCIVLSCTAYGFIKSQLWSERLKQLRDLEKIFVALSGDIRYGQVSLPESFERIAGQVEMPFSRFLKNLCGEMKRCGGKTFDTIFREEISVVLKESALKKQDKDSLAHMGGYLGHLDRETQVRMIQLYLKELDTTIFEVTGSIHSRQKLCRMLGAVSGILIVILLL